MEKRRFDLYVHGNLISRGYCSCNDSDNGAGITGNVPFEEVDTRHGIIVEGDMQVDNIYTMNRKIGAPGFVCGRGKAIHSDEFKSMKGTNQ